MKNPKSLLAFGCLAVALLLTATAPRAEAADTIKVTFTNKTSLKVSFYLNGGSGLKTSLTPGQSQSFNVVMDSGVQPIVGIYQSSGQRRDFTISHGGRYTFQVKDGEVQNFFE